MNVALPGSLFGFTTLSVIAALFVVIVGGLGLWFLIKRTRRAEARAIAAEEQMRQDRAAHLAAAHKLAGAIHNGFNSIGARLSSGAAPWQHQLYATTHGGSNGVTLALPALAAVRSPQSNGSNTTLTSKERREWDTTATMLAETGLYFVNPFPLDGVVALPYNDTSLALLKEYVETMFQDVLIHFKVSTSQKLWDVCTVDDKVSWYEWLRAVVKLQAERDLPSFLDLFPEAAVNPAYITSFHVTGQ